MAWNQYFDWDLVKQAADTLQLPSNLVRVRNFLSGIGETQPLQNSKEASFVTNQIIDGGNIILQTQGNTQRVSVAPDFSEEVPVKLFDNWFGYVFTTLEADRLTDRLQMITGKDVETRAKELVLDAMENVYKYCMQKVVNAQEYILGYLLTNRAIPGRVEFLQVNQKGRNNQSVANIAGEVTSGTLADFTADPISIIAEHINEAMVKGITPRYVILGKSLAAALNAKLVNALTSIANVPRSFTYISPDLSGVELPARGAYSITEIQGINILGLNQKVTINDTKSPIIGDNVLSIIGDKPWQHIFSPVNKTNGGDDGKSIGNEQLYIDFSLGVALNSREQPFELNVRHITLPFASNMIYTTQYTT